MKSLAVIQDSDEEAIPASTIPMDGLPVLRNHLCFDSGYGK
jgi:hypothetical protein